MKVVLIDDDKLVCTALKTILEADDIPSLKAVIMGQSVFGEDIITKIPSLLHDHKKLNIIKYNLSEKELEIIRLVADGLNNKEIANHLYLSEGTIRNYLSIILDKLGLRDRTQLAIFYFKTI